MKKAIIAILTLGTFLNAHAGILAYTQNNPPSQKELKRTHNVILNADALWGRVEMPIIFLGQDFGSAFPLTYARQSGGPDAGTKVLNMWTLKNDHKIGYSGGLGVSVSRNVNVSVQYKYIRSGAYDGPHTTTKGADVAIFIGNENVDQVYFGPRSSFETNQSIELRNHFRTRLRFIDLVVQATRWMTGRILIQPFAGGRYVYEKANSDTNAIDLENITRTYEANRQYTKSSIGVLFGADIKYMINNYFHFFSVLTGQLLADMSEKIKVRITSNLSVNNVSTNGTIDYTVYEPAINVTLRNSWGYKFGFAFEHAFKDNWLISVRIFLDLQENLYKTYGAGFTLGF